MQDRTHFPSANTDRDGFAALQEAIAPIRQALLRRISRLQNQAVSETGTPDSERAALSPTLPALEILSRNFALNAFERNVLLLCAGMGVDSDFPYLCAQAQSNPQLAYPTPGLAMALFPKPRFNAFHPQSPLRKWQLIQLGASVALLQRSTSIDENLLFYLAGEPYTDPVLEATIAPVTPAEPDICALPSRSQLLHTLTVALQTARNQAGASPVCLYGGNRESRRAIVARACQEGQYPLKRMSVRDLPIAIKEIQNLACRWQREARTNDSVLLVECEAPNPEGDRGEVLAKFLQQVSTPVAIGSETIMPELASTATWLEVPELTFAERKTIWTSELGDRARSLDRKLDKIADRFPLPPENIATICRQTSSLQSPEALANRLWEICRTHARARLDPLAQRVQTSMTWDALVLHDACLQNLKRVVATARNRFIVHQEGGFANNGERGLGLCALFTGQSGTGKTTAGEIIAKELNLDCYRIDLSAIVSKYIGETEKNLKQIFDAAEAGSVVLLFDEADALFGKRGQVKEARDRYANQEVSYLLQRIETYPGLAILTTNLQQSIDDAFVRRLRFIVQFPFPDVAQREEIWRRTFPKETRTQALNYRRLANLNVAGGEIRNIALNAAFLAADAGEPVTMSHLLQATHQEYAKQNRIPSGGEIWGWVEEPANGGVGGTRHASKAFPERKRPR